MTTSMTTDRRAAMRTDVVRMQGAVQSLAEQLDRIGRQFEAEGVDDYDLAAFVTEEVSTAMRAFEEVARKYQQHITTSALRLLRDAS